MDEAQEKAMQAAFMTPVKNRIARVVEELKSFGYEPALELWIKLCCPGPWPPRPDAL